MKVYVDKNDVDVLDDLFEATNSYECWACNRDDNLEIVSLADYTKQVRKEVLSDLMNMLGDRAELIDCGGVAEFMFTTYDLSMCGRNFGRRKRRKYDNK
jgi:hypothetical protein